MTGPDVGATVIAWGGLLALISRSRVRRVLKEHENRVCECDGSGTVLTDGPCDGAPVEVPCSCRRVPQAAFQYFRSSAKNLDLPLATARNGVQRNADGDGAPLSPSASLWHALAEPGPKTPGQLANIHHLALARPEVRHNSVGGAQRNGPDSLSLLAAPGQPFDGPDAA